MPLLAMIFSIYNKSHGMDHQTSHYVGIQFSILASAIIPFLIFRLENAFLLLLSLSPCVLSLLAFDFVHGLFGVGYYQVGLNETGYSLTTMRVMIGLLLVAGGSLFLKRSVEKNEKLNLELIDQLTETNNKNKTQLEEITAQNEQISDQKDKLEKNFAEIKYSRDQLNLSKEQLSDALKTIRVQQRALVDENKILAFEVLKKNDDLTKNNQQLIKYNNDLEQFSYTVSHNLRGPVATIMGLLSIINKEGIDEGNSVIFTKLQKTVNHLDDTIRDLNRVLDIRSGTFQVRKPISFRDVVTEVKASLDKEIQQSGILFTESYKESFDFISIPSLIKSIVYYLVNNAIKYRSLKRKPEIKILTGELNNNFIITIFDNGNGIDLRAHGEKVFQLYKRFNTHTEGKGIGLYLVKLQTEILGGKVEIASAVDEFTEFKISLPILEQG